MSAFWSEWILGILEYQDVGIRMVLSHCEYCEEDSQWALKDSFKVITLSVQPQDGKSRALDQQQGSRVSNQFEKLVQTLRDANCLVNSKNSNVQHGFSSNTWVMRLEQENWDR